jgi:plastocyanin
VGRVGTGAVSAAVLALMLASCGGSSNTSPSTSTTSTSTTTSTTPNSATITITSAGVNPSTVTIAVGGQVTFVNNDSAAHDMQSDPHPEHTDCPALAQVGFLNPNQSRTSGNLNTARTCGYHDHNQAEVAKWKGRIVVQ